MTSSDRKRQRVIFNLARILVFNAVLLPVFFVGQIHHRGFYGGSYMERAWPVYVICAITVVSLFVLSYQWNVMDYNEKKNAKAEDEAERGLVEQ